MSRSSVQSQYLCRPQATNPRLGKIISTKTFEIGTIHRKFMRIPYNLTNADPLDHKLVANIIGSVAKFPAYMGQEKKCRHAIYDFCALSGVAWDAATAATQLARIHPRDSWIIDCAHCETGPVQRVLWIYTALEELHESREEAGGVDNIGDLLQALFLHRPVQGRTTVTALRTILWALSSEAQNVCEQGLPVFAFKILCSADHWFSDNKLQPVLHDHFVWLNLGCFTYKTSPFSVVSDYITLGCNAEGLPCWLAQLPSLLGGESGDALLAELHHKFQAVLSRVWSSEETDGHWIGDERTIVMAVTVLADMWKQFEISKPQEIHGILPLVMCTISTAFCPRLIIGHHEEYRINKTSQRLKEMMMVQPGNAIQEAAEKLNKRTSHVSGRREVEDAIKEATNLLSKLSLTIMGDLESKQEFSDGGQGTEFQRWMESWRMNQSEFPCTVKLQLGDRKSNAGEVSVRRFEPWQNCPGS
ncbi:hypothetical protein B0H13DRAFT_1895020 [Mycena leptocephala]|nr:hypothetical protein B0H13DRAFT_1895020 [Mycena leptocephala]